MPRVFGSNGPEYFLAKKWHKESSKKEGGGGVRQKCLLPLGTHLGKKNTLGKGKLPGAESRGHKTKSPKAPGRAVGEGCCSGVFGGMHRKFKEARPIKGHLLCSQRGQKTAKGSRLEIASNSAEDCAE